MLPFSVALQNLKGWRANGLAFLLGLLAALAFPPFNLIPVLWLCFPALVFLVQGASGKRAAFARGWFFAFGLLVVSLYWIAASMFVDIKSFWWALPFAVAGLPACFALYYGFASLAAFQWGLRRADGVFFFALCWFVADMARAHLFTGFPWDIMGYVWGDVLPVLQITSVIGIHGLTFVTLGLAVLPACWVICERKKNAKFLIGAGLALLIGMAAWGQWRLETGRVAMVPDVHMRLLQPGTDQAMKWKAEQRLANFQRIMMLTFTVSSEKPITHYIWPETAVAYYLAEEEGPRRRIAEAMGKDSHLITGVVRRQEVEGGQDRYYNSLIAMDSRGTILAGYDKYHLVPFGEYMPHRDLVPFPVISGLGIDFTPGPGIQTTRVPGLPPLSGLICYEAIFSGEVADRADEPSLLLNLTNDGWYKNTIGPFQHYAIVKVRAIEEGLPLVRVANEGFTAVVDPYGRAVAEVGPSHAAFVDSDLPMPLDSRTPLVRYGHTPIGIVYLVFALLLVIRRATSRQKHRI